MPVSVWKTTEKQILKNAELAAATTVEIISAPQRVDAYNMLLVQNFDANSDIEIRLNDVTSDALNEKFFVQRAGGFVNLGGDVPIWFRKVFMINRSAANVVAANSVIIRVAKVVPAVISSIGEPVSNASSPTAQTGFVIG